jgi:hypothetical protein
MFGFASNGSIYFFFTSAEEDVRGYGCLVLLTYVLCWPKEYYIFTSAKEDLRGYDGCLVLLTSDLCWYKRLVNFYQCREGCERMANLVLP